MFKKFFQAVKIKHGIITGFILGILLSFVIIITTLLLTRFARDISDYTLLMNESANSLAMILIFIAMGFLPGIGFGLAAANIDNFFKPADRKIVPEIYNDNDLELQKKNDELINKRKKRILQKIFIFNISLFIAIIILSITVFFLGNAN